MFVESSLIKDEDFMFENTLVKVFASRNCHKIELVGFKVGPFEEGKEYEVRFWIARELEKAGIVRLQEEELLDKVKLHKIHWKERVQSGKQISSLSEDFYPRLRWYLARLKKEAVNNPEKMKEHEKVKRLSRDVVNCRLKKIVSLASTPVKSNYFLKNLTREERAIYERLSSIITEWRSKILKVGDEPD